MCGHIKRATCTLIIWQKFGVFILTFLHENLLAVDV
jgi:hypothetical protein